MTVQARPAATNENLLPPATQYHITLFPGIVVLWKLQSNAQSVKGGGAMPNTQQLLKETLYSTQSS